MKLKESFIVQNIEDTQYLVAVGENAFSGLVKNNKTAAVIVDLLKTDTTEDAIVDAMFDRFDAPREVIASDVAEVIGKLRSIGAIEE